MSRAFFIQHDIHGIDPLRDTLAKALTSVKQSTKHTVTQDEIGHSGLLALKYYNDETLGHVILQYNALGHELEMYAGQEILIPSKSELKANLRTTKVTSQTKRTVSI